MINCESHRIRTSSSYVLIGTFFHPYVPSSGERAGRAVTCSNSLSSPSTTAWFHWMTSENGNSHPLLSNTGIQAAYEDRAGRRL